MIIVPIGKDILDFENYAISRMDEKKKPGFGLLLDFLDREDFLVDRFGLHDDDRDDGTIVRPFADPGDLIDDVHTFGDASEGGVVAVEEEVIRVADEELATRGIGIHRPGHRDDAALMGEGVIDPIGPEFAFDGVARSSGAVAARASALDHETFDDAVEGQSVIETLGNEGGEIIRGYRRRFAVEFDLDVAVVFDVENDHFLCPFLFLIIEDDVFVRVSHFRMRPDLDRHRGANMAEVDIHEDRFA